MPLKDMRISCTSALSNRSRSRDPAISYEKKYRELKATSETQYALLKQQFDFKCTEISELQEKYKQTLDNLTKVAECDNSQGIVEQLKLAKDNHLKEIIDLKSRHQLAQSRLEDKLEDIRNQLSSANQAIQELEKEVSTLKSEKMSIKDQSRLLKKELELKIQILEFEKSSSCGKNTSKILELQETHKSEIDSLKSSYELDIKRLKDAHANQLILINKEHDLQRENLERRNAILQVQVKDAINNICTEMTNKSSRDLEKYLDSIASEKESDFTATLRHPNDDILDASELVDS